MPTETAKSATVESMPMKSSVTTRMMDLLETLDQIQGQCDSILGAALGHDSAPREAGPSAILDYQVDFALAQARLVLEKLATVYCAL